MIITLWLVLITILIIVRYKNLKVKYWKKRYLKLYDALKQIKQYCKHVRTIQTNHIQDFIRDVEDV